MRIREVSNKAEKLIETGKEVEAKRDRAMSNVQNAQRRVSSAQSALDRASQTDEEGNPVGDVGAAQAELDAAIMDLEYREDELREAEAELESINAEKYETIHTLDEYNEGESGNLSILKQLQGKKFGGNVGAMIAAIIGQMTLAETTRNNLLSSLGLNGQTSTHSSGGTSGGVNQILSSPGSNGIFYAKQQCVDLLKSKKNSFTADKWSKLSFQQRADALSGLAVDAGRAMRIDIKGAKFFNGPRSSRGNFSGDGYLYLNSDVLYDETQREDALDTIFHEGRHAFQRAAMNDPKTYGISEETAESWRNNQPPNNYIRHEQDPIGYAEQPIEKDAFSFAGSVISEGLK